MSNAIERLNHLADTALHKRTRYSEVIAICKEAIAEIARLREVEAMYDGLCK